LKFSPALTSAKLKRFEIGSDDKREDKLMNMTGFLIFLVIGAAAGWLAGTIMKGGGFGLLGNIIIGVIGGVVGGFLFKLLAIAAGGLIGSIVTAAVGAVVLLFAVGHYRKNLKSSEPIHKGDAI